MSKKTNILAAAVFAAAAFAAMPSANASVAAGQMATAATAPVVQTLAVVNGAGGAAETANLGKVQLAHGRRWRWRHFHGHYGHGHYGGGCRWLKRKWHRTGRYYWKKRYFRCINGWY